MNSDIDQLRTEVRSMNAKLVTLERLFRQWQRDGGLSTPDFNIFASIKHLEWKLAALEDKSRWARERH